MLELDELWSFVDSRENARWVWVALCRQIRQIMASFVGDRSAESARALREAIPPGYRCQAARSDFWLAYEEAFPRHTHRCLGRFVRKTLSFSTCPDTALKSQRFYRVRIP